MQTFILKGLVEGLAGVSTVQAGCAEDVFKMFPLLEIARSKISIKGLVMKSIYQCDG